MKKNGKRYKAQPNKKRQQIHIEEIRNIKIDQKVDDMNIENLAISQIVVHNPIINAAKDVKVKYVNLLEKYLKLVRWNRRKFVNAELEAYKKIIFGGTENDLYYELS